jgi:hypothetical protein
MSAHPTFPHTPVARGGWRAVVRSAATQLVLGPESARATRRPAEPRLERCPGCRRDFVHAVERAPAGEGRWLLLLRCGECDSWREVTASGAAVARFDAETDRRARVLASALERLAAQA